MKTKKWWQLMFLLLDQIHILWPDVTALYCTALHCTALHWPSLAGTAVHYNAQYSVSAPKVRVARGEAPPNDSGRCDWTLFWESSCPPKESNYLFYLMKKPWNCQVIQVNIWLETRLSYNYSFPDRFRLMVCKTYLAMFSRPGQSQGLPYKQLCDSLIN